MKQYTHAERQIIKAWTGTLDALAAKLGRTVKSIRRYKARTGLTPARRFVTDAERAEMIQRAEKGERLYQIAMRLGLCTRTVRNVVRQKIPSPRKHYTPAEIAIVRKNKDTLKDLAMKLGRTVSSVKNARHKYRRAA